MAKINIVRSSETRPLQQLGPATTRAYFEGEDDPLHLLSHQLDAGVGLRFTGEPTDRLVYVLEGGVRINDKLLAAGSSLIVEYGAETQVVGDAASSTLLDFFVRERRPADRPGGHVHLLSDENVPRSAHFHGTQGIGGGLHADASCPTCQVWLHEQSYVDADVETALHSHSEDEIIFITGGEIRFGRERLGPGAALAIAANARYSFHSGEGGLKFINFRSSSPTYTSADGSSVLDEAELWRSALGSPEYQSL